MTGTAAIPIPQQGRLRLADAAVQAGGTVFEKGELVAYESAADPTLDFIAWQWDSILGSRSRSRSRPSMALLRHRERSDRRFDSGALLSGRNDNNWYHLLIEYLPRATTGCLDPERRALRRQPPHALIGSRCAGGTLIAGGGGAEKVFLRRRSVHHGLLNEAELVKIAEAHGLTAFDPGQLTWGEQVEVFATASLVVGASGAVMGNYSLMPPVSEILAITSQPLADFILPATIAHVRGVGFRYVLGAGTTKLTDHPNRNNWLHADFSVERRRGHAASADRANRVARPSTSRTGPGNSIHPVA